MRLLGAWGLSELRRGACRAWVPLLLLWSPLVGTWGGMVTQSLLGTMGQQGGRLSRPPPPPPHLLHLPGVQGMVPGEVLSVGPQWLTPIF